jgi:hypothetical protein
MRQFEQDWLELGNRVARSLHYQHPATSGSSRPPRPKPRTALHAGADQVRGRPMPPRPKPNAAAMPEEVMPLTPPSIP